MPRSIRSRSQKQKTENKKDNIGQEEEIENKETTWKKKGDPLEVLLKTASQVDNLDNSILEEPPQQIRLNASKSSKSSKSVRRPARILNIRKKKKKFASISSTTKISLTQDYVEEDENLYGSVPSVISKDKLTLEKNTRKPVEAIFPGIPLHIVKSTSDPSKMQKNLKKQVQELNNKIDKLKATEQEVELRIALLEQREAELLKSCEKLQEISLVQQVHTKSTSRKRAGTVTKPVEVPQQHTLDVDTRDVQICEQLGTGASGASVYLVNVGGWCCAMKELSRNISNQIDSECFEKEMALLYQIPKHPNIARYLFHKKLRGRYCLFMSRYSGTLRDEVKRRKKKKEYFPLRYIIRIVIEIINGITFLHSHSIIHRDLKCDNVFIAVNRLGEIRDVAIGDFDTSKRLGVSLRPKSSVGTPGFMAPEVLNACGKNEYTFSADIFSFGMMMYELMSLEYPYYECKSPIEVSSKIIDGVAPILLDKQKEDYQRILPIYRNCISKLPENRSTASEIRDQLVELRSNLDKDRYKAKTTKKNENDKTTSKVEVNSSTTDETNKNKEEEIIKISVNEIQVNKEDDASKPESPINPDRDIELQNRLTNMLDEL